MMPVNHVAIIPDGNRRWAEKNHLPALKGHEAGIQKLGDTLQWANDAGVSVLSLWILSTENLNRSNEEVTGLFNYFEKGIIENLKDEYIKKYNVRVNFFGELWRLPPRIQALMHDVESRTSSNNGKVLNLFTAYGGRGELLHAVNSIIKDRSSAGVPITESDFSKYLFTKNVPDPDLIIRTSGEMRMSGFLPWQSVYSEYYFSDKLWPDFQRSDFMEAISEYESRKRRFGK